MLGLKLNHVSKRDHRLLRCVVSVIAVEPSLNSTQVGHMVKLLISYAKGQVENAGSCMDWICDACVCVCLPRDFTQTASPPQIGLWSGKEGDWQYPNQHIRVEFCDEEQRHENIYTFMSMQLSDQNYGHGVCLFTTVADKVITSVALYAKDLTGLVPCNHQDANPRMLLLLTNASEDGHEEAMIKTVDTILIVLVASAFDSLGLSEIWILFGTKKIICIYDVGCWHKQRASTVPCNFRVWYNQSVLWHRQENSLGSLVTISTAIKADPGHLLQTVISLTRGAVLLYSESCPASRFNLAHKEVFGRRHGPWIQPANTGRYFPTSQKALAVICLHVYLGVCTPALAGNPRPRRLGLSENC